MISVYLSISTNLHPEIFIHVEARHPSATKHLASPAGEFGDPDGGGRPEQLRDQRRVGLDRHDRGAECGLLLLLRGSLPGHHVPYHPETPPAILRSGGEIVKSGLQVLRVLVGWVGGRGCGENQFSVLLLIILSGTIITIKCHIIYMIY